MESLQVRLDNMVAAAEAVLNDCDSWLDGDLDGLKYNELLMAFQSALTAAIARATKGE